MEHVRANGDDDLVDLLACAQGGTHHDRALLPLGVEEGGFRQHALIKDCLKPLELILIHAELRQGLDEFALFFAKILAPDNGEQLILPDRVADPDRAAVTPFRCIVVRSTQRANLHDLASEARSDAGEVVEINETLADKPELVNTDPYGDGWMIRVRMSDATELDDLMNAEEYEEYCETESH